MRNVPILLILFAIINDCAAQAAMTSDLAPDRSVALIAEKSNPADDGPEKTSFSGNVSWYGIPFHGRKTASGEIFNMYKPSAAHLTLPLPTKALVEDPKTGNAVIVRINDRGPYVKTRVMDLSREAARQLGTLSRGVAFVDVTVLESRKKKSSK